MSKYKKFLQIVVMTTWITGCVGGAYTGDPNMTNAGVVSFFILWLLN